MADERIVLGKAKEEVTQAQSDNDEHYEELEGIIEKERALLERITQQQAEGGAEGAAEAEKLHAEIEERTTIVRALIAQVRASIADTELVRVFEPPALPYLMREARCSWTTSCSRTRLPGRRGRERRKG